VHDIEAAVFAIFIQVSTVKPLDIDAKKYPQKVSPAPVVSTTSTSLPSTL